MREESILRKIFRIIALILVSIVFLGPFLWMVFTSFKPLAEALRLPPTFLPETWVPQNYADAWQSGPFLHYTKNSVIVTLSVVALQLLTIIPASYAFAKMDFKGKKILFSLILVTMMIPAQLIFLPVYLMFSKVNLINSYWSLILPWASSAFGIFLLRQRFMQVPDEIIEAAVLDNTPTWKIIYKIMLPQAKGTVITIALFTFISEWNDYFWPLVMTSNDDIRTLPLGVSMLKSTLDGIHWNTVMAGNVILILPIVIIYLFAQKEIIKAFTYSGIK
ncbi:carbohydrate ABC transporter permease [Anaerococcus sp. Marseille-Q7828]|uniref:carbohydrate ABC transporter permease n=1 Tax=Anaerococcus sp. Marseille-Q7828 TaxID=3036300 RepID=UPI0024ADCBD6|nr:carbohydrate ABC transporter permease [Anaerococcus sp. Marseille-Q7828]